MTIQNSEEADMPKILLFDGFSILNRGFYALPLFSNSAGEYTNAVYGFLSIFLRFMDEEKPDYVTVAFDLPEPTFRHVRYAEYKATRKSMPEELRTQIPILKNLLEKMGIPIAACPGYEADDVIGTLAVKAIKKDISPVIISGDRDLLQLATDVVLVRIPKTKAGKTEVENYHAADVMAKYGVSPTEFIDVKALMGDSSDNVPGVPSIGEVTATKIIQAYGSLENAIDNALDIKPKRASENLIQFKEQARMCRELVTIKTDIPCDLVLANGDSIWNACVYDEVKRLEMKSLYKHFPKDIIAASQAKVLPVGDEPMQLTLDMTGAESKSTDTKTAADNLHVSKDILKSYPIIHNADEAAVFFSSILSEAAFFTLWDEKECLVGMGVVVSPGSNGTYLCVGSDLSAEELIIAARPWLESKTHKWALDIKTEVSRLRAYGVHPVNMVFDALLAGYVINALQATKQPADIALTFLDEIFPTLEDILGNKGKRGSARMAISDMPLEKAAGYIAGVADIIFRCYKPMTDAMTKADLTDLYKKIELPLVAVLSDMETIGIKVDPLVLTKQGKTLDTRLAELTQEIYNIADEEFNIQSPAQLGVILFDKLGLKGGKKTTQGYSTAAEELEKLADKHPIIPLVQEYRVHAKLKSTYIDGLLPLINEHTSRIHSTFNQALTATGRISSAEPNLQNIPIRMPLGRQLRKAFIPREESCFVGADYSQIELRVLAHISGDGILINAFKEEQDIHRLTASQVLGIPPQEVTQQQRSNAKAINFGIVYGISAYGLSKDIGVSQKEAEAYIQGYFEKYPKVKTYLDETIKKAKTDGYVSTLFGRRRTMPELKSPNHNQRAFGERVAMNMPIQGTAADIIKIAMINVYSRLLKENLETKLILQVHDELLLETPYKELEQVKVILKEEMENAVSLDVPLTVEVNVGESWYDTK